MTVLLSLVLCTFFWAVSALLDKEIRVHNKTLNNLGKDLKASSQSILNTGLENTSVFLQNDLRSTPWSYQMFGMAQVQWTHSFLLRLHKQLLATSRKLHCATGKAFSVLSLSFLHNYSIYCIIVLYENNYQLFIVLTLYFGYNFSIYLKDFLCDLTSSAPLYSTMHYLPPQCFLPSRTLLYQLLIFLRLGCKANETSLIWRTLLRDVFHSLNLTGHTLKCPSPPLRCPYYTGNAPVCLDTILSIIIFAQDINKGLATQLILMHKMHLTIVF